MSTREYTKQVYEGPTPALGTQVLIN
uniref:Uncharacterized protein n=1 Tax=Rhizophora mucronata TaxID=61149 RepID=A0A2P2M6J6_RHIMU